MPTQLNAADSSRSIVEPPLPRASFTINPKQYTGPRAEEVLQQRQQHLSAGQYHFYRIPLMLVEASMQYCFDDKGKVYVDGYSNVCHVGHCHPHFVASCQNAMGNIISNTRYLHPTIGKYAEKLKSKLPSSLCVCYFVNSGSEANDLALRLARVHTGRNGVVCLEHAYHGTTATCTGISTSLSTGTQKGTVDYDYCARDVHVAPLPDPYRGKYRGDPDGGRKYAEHVKEIIDRTGDIGCYIHESVQGVGGQVVYPKDYLKRVYKYIREAGGVTIADEVQTGFGRTGTHFWAFEPQGVTPDILVMGKPIGNGFPLGAVVCTREIARSFDGVQYFNTNGGNPVACAAGLAVLEIIERDGLQKNALEVSVLLMKELNRLKEKHSIIGDVRGVGLFVGIELVRDRETLEPADKETAEVMERCRHFGLLVGKGGYHNNVIRMKPPLCFNTEDAAFAVKTLDVVLTEVASRSRTPGYTASDALQYVDTYVNCTAPISHERRYDFHIEEAKDRAFIPKANNQDYDRPNSHGGVRLTSGANKRRDLKNIPRALLQAVEQSVEESGSPLNGSHRPARRSAHFDDEALTSSANRRSFVSRHDNASEDEGPQGRLARKRPRVNERTPNSSRFDDSDSDDDYRRGDRRDSRRSERTSGRDSRNGYALPSPF